MGRFKLVVALILALLTIVLVLQNTDTVETKVLFITIAMPRAVLLMVTLLAGVAVGLLLAAALSGKRMRGKR